MTQSAGQTSFDFGEWKREVVVGSAAGKRTLVLRDAQHEYVFTES